MGWLKSDSAKSDSERYLNIIYFLDASQTKTIKVSVARLKIVLGLFVAWLVWFGVSSYLNIRLWSDRAQLEARLKASLAALFQYEVQYDRVYDRAYGNASNKNRVASQSDEEPRKAAPAREVEADAQPTEQANVPEAVSVDTKLEVKVAKPVVEVGESELDVRFDLVSSVTEGKAQGYIYGIAEFKTDAGETIKIMSPEGIAADETIDPKQAVSFAIRRFKQQNLSFTFDPRKPGYFINVQIHVLSRNGIGRDVYDVPVQIRIGQSKASLEQPAKSPG